jgi:hypothetical protein
MPQKSNPTQGDEPPMQTPLSWTQSRTHYWMLPAFVHTKGSGGNLILGPLQVNWYSRGLRLHITWPFTKTFTLYQRA